MQTVKHTSPKQLAAMVRLVNYLGLDMAEVEAISQLPSVAKLWLKAAIDEALYPPKVQLYQALFGPPWDEESLIDRYNTAMAFDFEPLLSILEAQGHPRLRRLIETRFDFTSNCVRSRTEVGVLFGLSSDRVRTWEGNSLTRMRRHHRELTRNLG